MAWYNGMVAFVFNKVIKCFSGVYSAYTNKHKRDAGSSPAAITKL